MNISNDDDRIIRLSNCEMFCRGALTLNLIGKGKIPATGRQLFFALLSSRQTFNNLRALKFVDWLLRATQSSLIPGFRGPRIVKGSVQSCEKFSGASQHSFRCCLYLQWWVLQPCSLKPCRAFQEISASNSGEILCAVLKSASPDSKARKLGSIRSRGS